MAKARSLFQVLISKRAQGSQLLRCGGGL